MYGSDSATGRSSFKSIFSSLSIDNITIEEETDPEMDAPEVFSAPAGGVSLVLEEELPVIVRRRGCTLRVRIESFGELETNVSL